MDHDELKDKILKAFGGRVPVSAKDRWAEFVKNRETEIFLFYDWVKDRRFYRWVQNHPDLEFGDGVGGIKVWIIEASAD